MDVNTLGEAMGWSLSRARYAQLLPSYEKLQRLLGITTVKQAAMLAAQLGHESVGLKYQEEIASGAAYEWRKDLGNIYAGDGVRFKGHGWIQVTGRHNHAAVSRWAHSRGLVPTATYFVDNPKHLGADAYCWIGPAWYLTAARPGWLPAAGRGDLETCTRMINGGLNGLADRRARYQRALKLGTRLLPAKEVNEVEKVIPYPRDQVKQDTYYNCGPASCQTIIRAATGKLIVEPELARRLGTTTNGTNYIGSFPAVLNAYTAGKYVHRDMPSDPPSTAQKERLWADIASSINAGFGVVANIVAPPSNYPRSVYPSTQNLAYRGGTVYHYIAVMGYAGTGGMRRVWIADSGFAPYGAWISFDQLATLIPPKGYAYATAKPPAAQAKETTVGVIERIKSLINKNKSFTISEYIALIDASVWRQEKLVSALARKQGIDVDAVLEAAIKQDVEGK